jgi:hypothetical protein
MLRDTSYEVIELHQYVLANELLLLIDQRAAYNAIFDRINRRIGGISFLRCLRWNRKDICH